MTHPDLRAAEESKKATRRAAARDRRFCVRLLCGAFLALALASTFAALPREQATPVLISAQAATIEVAPEPEADKYVAVHVTETPKQRRPRRQRRAPRRRLASTTPACRCECGPQVARK